MKAPTSAFGMCPTCHALPELVNAGTRQYGVCRQHRLAWEICEFPNDDAEALGDPVSIDSFTLVEPHYPDGGDPDAPAAKSTHESLKARKARAGRRLGARG
ncbi:MAG: hypothetical protein AB7I01_01890 [Gammaproteobacteria bacterium]